VLRDGGGDTLATGARPRRAQRVRQPLDGLRGQVVYLARRGHTVAAVVPPEVAAPGHAAVTALEDAADVRAAREALADPAPSVPLDDVLARYAADLDSQE
jgi:hypothetical protein